MGQGCPQSRSTSRVEETCGGDEWRRVEVVLKGSGAWVQELRSSETKQCTQCPDPEQRSADPGPKSLSKEERDPEVHSR